MGSHNFYQNFRHYPIIVKYCQVLRLPNKHNWRRARECGQGGGRSGSIGACDSNRLLVVFHHVVMYRSLWRIYRMSVYSPSTAAVAQKGLAIVSHYFVELLPRLPASLSGPRCCAIPVEGRSSARIDGSLHTSGPSDTSLVQSNPQSMNRIIKFCANRSLESIGSHPSSRQIIGHHSFEQCFGPVSSRQIIGHIYCRNAWNCQLENSLSCSVKVLLSIQGNKIDLCMKTKKAFAWIDDRVNSIIFGGQPDPPVESLILSSRNCQRKYVAFPPYYFRQIHAVTFISSQLFCFYVPRNGRCSRVR